MRDSNSRLVYSSDGGRVEPPAVAARQRSKGSRRGTANELPPDPGDGIVRLHRGRPTRGGGPRTFVVGLGGTDSELDAILKRCKQRIGAGGSRQARVLVLQGDHRDQLRTLLEAEGHQVKLAGG